MKKKIQTNFFCKSNYWSKRMLKIKEIVKKIIKIDDLDFKKNNFYIVNLVFVDTAAFLMYFSACKWLVAYG